jgi:hypothetical protein
MTRGGMVASIFHRYSVAIKAEVAAASPKALAYMTAAAAKHRDNAYPSMVPINELVNNPAMYDAHGIDPEQYSDKITSGRQGTLWMRSMGSRSMKLHIEFPAGIIQRPPNPPKRMFPTLDHHPWPPLGPMPVYDDWALP